MDLGVQILRILCAAVEEKSFSGAARKLKITQPTVSQQIARLESEIDGKIFERSRKAIELTMLGEKLYRTAKEIVQKADVLTNELKTQKSRTRDLVRYAMPESCQWTPHYRKIMSLISEYPGIQVDITITNNRQIQELLKNSEIDFAFVTGDVEDKGTVIEKFANEEYCLVAKSAEFFEPLKNKDYSDFRFISYPAGESFFVTWADAAGVLTEIKDAIVEPNAKIGNMIGAIHATLEGAGCLVVPTHCILNELEDKKLVVYPLPQFVQASQPISIIKNPRQYLSVSCQTILDLLIKSKRGLI